MHTPVRTGRASSLAAILTLAVTASLGLGAPAVADGDPTPAPPSQQQLDQAQQNVATKQHGVDAIKAQLVRANQQLNDASTKAEIAAEAYNGAHWAAKKSRKASKRADAAAAAAQATVVGQRAGIARLVVGNYRGGPQVDQLQLMLDPGSQSDILGTYGALRSATSSMDAAYARFQTASTRAKAERSNAAHAQKTAEQAEAKTKAAHAKAAAAEQVAAASQADLDRRSQSLTAQLASAQHISKGLAKKHAEALAAQAAQEAAAQAAAEAAAQAAAQQAAEQAAAQAAAEAAAQAAQPKDEPSSSASTPSSTPSDSADDPTDDSSDDPTDDPAGDPTDDPTDGTTGSTGAPAPSGGAAAAIDFAKSQIGDPYKWGAVGPDSWDCSGLMLKAWAAAGVSLPRTSASQYGATTPITRDQLQPGDLIFWGSSARSIHHVAMYLGDNMMIHAPRSGQDVMIASVDYWIAPNYFGRIG